MNLLIRFFILIIRCFFAKRIHILDHSRIHYRVLPWDCDINFHMTNSRYLSFMDLGRTYFLAESGLFKQIIFIKKWLPVIHSTDLTFIRPLSPFQKFDVVTRLLAWDDKYFYMEQRIESEGLLYALALMKGLFMQKNKKIPSGDVIALVDDEIKSPDIKIIKQRWQDLHEAKRQLDS